MKSPGQPATGAVERVPRRHGGSGRWTRCLPAPLMRRSSCASRFRWICVPGDLPGTTMSINTARKCPSYSYASEACSAANRRTGDRGGRGGGAYASAAGPLIGYHIGVDPGRMARPGIWRRVHRLLPVNRQRFSAFLAERTAPTERCEEAWDDPAVSCWRTTLIPCGAAGHGMPRKCSILRGSV